MIVKHGRKFKGFTAEGRRVLASSQRMLLEPEMFQRELDSGLGKPRGVISISAVPTAVPIAARFSAMLKIRYPGTKPSVRSMNSNELEPGLESLTLDIGLGYTDRLRTNGSSLQQIPQYTEQYFFVRRAATLHDFLQIGPSITWAEAGGYPLCMLTREMHNRTIVNQAIATVGVKNRPAIETNLILTLALSVVDGNVCSIMPGALVGALRSYRELEALPLVEPDIRTAIGFMAQGGDRPSRTLEASLELVRDPTWLGLCAIRSGLLCA